MHLRLVIITMSLAMCGIAYLTFRSVSPPHSSGTLPTDPPTPYIRFEPQAPPTGTVLVVHGLNSNKDFMRTVSMAMADGGFDVYAVDLPGHGASQAPFSFSETVNVIEQLIEALGSETILVGHSMGGSALAQLAASNESETMVLYSPAPIRLGDIHVDRLLIVTGMFELPQINNFIPELIDATGVSAFWWKYPRALHSTALFDPSKLRAVVRWMGGHAETLRVGNRFAGLAFMTLAGLIIPFAIPLKTRLRNQHTNQLITTSRVVIVEYVAAVCIAVVLLGFVAPLHWLRLFAADYLVSLVLIAGLILWRGRRLSVSRRGLAIAILSAAYVIGVFAVGIGSQFLHLVPEGTQWLLLPILTLASLPLFLRDEETLRSFSSRWINWSTFLVTRILLWASAVTGVLILNNESAFLLLIMHFVVVFWVALWWMTGVVARRTGEPAAAAIFAALVQGWVFAATFVRI